MPAYMTKSQLVDKIAQLQELEKKDVKGDDGALAESRLQGAEEERRLRRAGLAKMSVIKKAATKARRGNNPFTKEPTIFKAKPARKVVRARPVKAAKMAV